jgi:hypothetical protein
VLAHPFKVGFSDSMTLVLLGGGLVMVLAFLVLQLLPSVELRSTSASAEARAQDRAEERAAASASAGDAASASLSGAVPGTASAEPVQHAGAHAAPVPTVVGDDSEGAGTDVPVGRHVAVPVED